jgi:hypothetical protein
MKFYYPSDAYYAEFTTQRFDTGAATTSDSLPVATANRNGVDDSGFALTVAPIDAGRYKITGTVPAYSSGDIVNISIAATVNSVAGKGVVDTFRVVSAANGCAGSNLDAAVSSRSAPATAQAISSNADMTAIKTQTDKLQFDGSNNIKSVKNAIGATDFNATEKASLNASTPNASVTVDTSAIASAVASAINRAGLYSITLQVNDINGLAIPGVNVYFVNTSGVTVRQAQTNSNGGVDPAQNLSLDAGSFTVKAFKAGYSIPNISIAVSANATVTMVGTAHSATQPEANYQTAYIQLANTDTDAVIFADPLPDTGQVISSAILTGHRVMGALVNGRLEIVLVKGGIYEVIARTGTKVFLSKTITVTSDDIHDLRSYA